MRDTFAMGSIGHRHRKGSAGNADGRALRAKRVTEGCDERALPVETVSGGESGSEPLRDIRMERYCEKVSCGSDALEAWLEAFCDEEGKSRPSLSYARCCRHRCGSREEVIARIAYLGSRSCPTSVDRRRKLEMLDALLLRAYGKAMGKGSSPKDISVFLDVLSRHDVAHGDVVRPKLEIVMPDMSDVLGTALGRLEKRLSLPVGAEVIDLPTSEALDIPQSSAVADDSCASVVEADY